MRDPAADDRQILICKRPLFSQSTNTVQVVGQIAGCVVLTHCASREVRLVYPDGNRLRVATRRQTTSSENVGT